MNELGNYRVLTGPTRILVDVEAEAGHRLQLISGDKIGEAVDSAADGGPVALTLTGLPDEACTVPLAIRIWPAGQEISSRTASLGEAALPDVLTLFGDVTRTPEDVAAFRAAMLGVLGQHIAPEQLPAAIGDFVGAVVALNVARIERERAATLARLTAEIEQQAAERIRLIQ